MSSEAAAPELSAPGPPGTGVLAKPRWRGVSHQMGFFLSLAATVALLAHAGSPRARLASAVFGTSLALLFGVSALYHRIDWTPAARAWMRRLDHAAIFVLIAGGYTPLFLLVPSPGGSFAALWAIWIGASIGVVKSIAWSKAPKWITALVCVTLGWTATGEIIARIPVVGLRAVGLLVGCGALYSLGAAVYALKRPNPAPLVFGYHEIFHALVVLASAVLYAHVWCVLNAVHG
jgi:hemolysin III